jgi:hypothetical protein
MSSIQLSGQTGKPNQDTIKCYGVTELKNIATSIVEGKTCDTLLSVSKLKLQLKDTIITEKNIEIENLNKISAFKDQIITRKENDIEALNKSLASEIKKHKWTKYGWAATATILGTLALLFALR